MNQLPPDEFLFTITPLHDIPSLVGRQSEVQIRDLTIYYYICNVIMCLVIFFVYYTKSYRLNVCLHILTTRTLLHVQIEDVSYIHLLTYLNVVIFEKYKHEQHHRSHPIVCEHDFKYTQFFFTLCDFWNRNTSAVRRCRYVCRTYFFFMGHARAKLIEILFWVKREIEWSYKIQGT